MTYEEQRQAELEEKFNRRISRFLAKPENQKWLARPADRTIKVLAAGEILESEHRAKLRTRRYS